MQHQSYDEQESINPNRNQTLLKRDRSYENYNIQLDSHKTIKLKKLINGFKDIQNDLKNENQMLKEDVSKLQKIFTSFSNQIRQQFIQMTSYFNEQTDLLNRQIQRLNIINEKLSKDNEEVKYDLQYTTKVLKQVRESEDELIEINNELEMKQQRQMKKIKDYQMNMQVLELRLYEAQKQQQNYEEYCDLEKQIEWMREETISMKLDLQQKEQQIDQLRAQLNISKSDPWKQDEDPWNINDSSDVDEEQESKNTKQETENFMNLLSQQRQNNNQQQTELKWDDDLEDYAWNQFVERQNQKIIDQMEQQNIKFFDGWIDDDQDEYEWEQQMGLDISNQKDDKFEQFQKEKKIDQSSLSQIGSILNSEDIDITQRIIQSQSHDGNNQQYSKEVEIYKTLNEVDSMEDDDNRWNQE